MRPLSNLPPIVSPSQEMKNGAAVFVDWKDDSSDAGTSGDGSFSGKGEFVRHVTPGEVGLEYLGTVPHCLVKISPDDLGSVFPVSAVKPA